MPRVQATLVGRDRFISRLREIADRARHPEPGLEAAHRPFIEGMQRQFETEGAYLRGSPWAPLSPPYAAWKIRSGYGARILVLTTRLETGLLRGGDDQIREVRGHTARFGVSGPPYFHYLQTGTRYMPARPFIEVSNPEFRASICRPVWTYVLNGTPGAGARGTIAASSR